MARKQNEGHHQDLAVAKAVVVPWIARFQEANPGFWVPGMGNYATPAFLARALRTGALADLVASRDGGETPHLEALGKALTG